MRDADLFERLLNLDNGSGMTIARKISFLNSGPMRIFSDNPSKRYWYLRPLRHVPPEQLIRYLVVGLWNTAFGYASYAGFTFLLSDSIPHSYLPACLLSSLVNITVAFFGYKWFVFKTTGNYLKEWLRCVAVYSGTILVSLACLPVLVFLIRLWGYDRAAPYLAGAILTGIGVITSFIGHKHISFRRGPEGT